MGQFFVSGTNTGGKKHVLLIEAASAKDALADARAKGLTEPVLETDEISALHQIETSEELSDKELLQLRRSGKWSNHFLMLKKYMVILSPLWVTPVVLFTANRIKGDEWDAEDYLRLGLFTGSVFMAVTIRFWPTRISMASHSFDALIESFVQADWSRVIELTERLEGSEIAQSELAFRKASALAATGNLNEALNLVAPWVDGEIDDPVCPEWVAKDRLADIYNFGGLPQRALETIEDAAKLAPDSAVMLLDLALFRITNGHVSDAQLALDDLQHLPLSAELLPVRDFAIGCICNEQGDTEEALNLLLPIRERIAEMVRSSPIWKMLLASIDHEIAISYSNAGDVEKAVAHFQKCESLLRAHKSTAKLARGERLTRHTAFPLNA